ncbi:glutathione S-transferase-like [Montipora capricornis]|uniref:glutathione S-transferase-like n=1 Tax=Montipora foliosa TaxID=591990 RepID=UPI0035F1B81C
MSGYKLYYFNILARGEMCRLSFAAAKIDFEDIRMNAYGEEWPKEKASGRPPLGQMPFIVTPEGKCLAQSATIMKYICKKEGLSPADSFDEALADMIVDGTNDFRSAVIRAHFEKDPAKKEDQTKQFHESTLPARLEKYTNLLGEKDFFFGDKMTYADIAFFEFFNSFLADGEPTVPNELENFPVLVEHYKRMLNVPEIKAWIATRPKCSFFP